MVENFIAEHPPDGAVSHNGLIIAEMVENFTATHPPKGEVSHNDFIIAEKHSFTNHHAIHETVVVSEY